MNLDARHVAAAGERRREDVMLHLARGPDQNDLRMEQPRGNLASHDAVVRHLLKCPGPAAKVDEDLLGVGEWPRREPRGAHLPMELRVERKQPFVALHRVGHAHPNGDPTDVAVGIGNDAHGGDGDGALADDRQRHVGDLALYDQVLAAH